MKPINWAQIATLLLLSACATGTPLTIYSQPPGAYITEAETGSSLGVAPIRTAYANAALQATKGDGGCFQAKGMVARWVSGAAASTNGPIWLCRGLGYNYQITMTRDPEAPDLERDLQFALSLQNAASQQQIATNARDAALVQILNGMVPDPSSRTTTTCTSRKVGTTVQTDCR